MSTPSAQIPVNSALDRKQDNAPAGFAGKVVIHTHGCKLNQADSSVLARQFRQSGYRVVEDVAEADIYVLNSCTVTATADAKARQALRAARRANPAAVVVAAGCYPQRAAGELAAMPAVSLVVGNEDKSRLASLAIAAHRDQQGPPQWEENYASFSVATEGVTGNLPGRSRGMVKIQEGCNQVCAYCIVPRVRGRERSIPPAEIVRQVNQSISEGCQEVTLTGTQLGTYGFDLPGASLRALIETVLTETDLARLRVSSLQPQEIDRELIALWLNDRRLCPHFHLPLQSGSDRILKAMRRRYSTTRFAETVAAIRQVIPEAGITADLIVGFPGETDADFEESLAFVAAMRFSDLHLFPYSIRPGTSAAYLESQVTEPVKKERMRRALQLTGQSFADFRSSQLGTVRPVLWEGENGGSDNNRLLGLTDNYIRVAAELDQTGGNLAGRPNTVTPARLLELSGNVVLAQPLAD